MRCELITRLTNLEAGKLGSSRALIWVRVIWVVASIIFAYVSTIGGDEAILAFWLFVVCTYPFSAIWWFYAYDALAPLASESIIVPFGLTTVIVCAYLFWFVFIPKIFRLIRNKSGKHS